MLLWWFHLFISPHHRQFHHQRRLQLWSLTHIRQIIINLIIQCIIKLSNTFRQRKSRHFTRMSSIIKMYQLSFQSTRFHQSQQPLSVNTIRQVLNITTQKSSLHQNYRNLQATLIIIHPHKIITLHMHLSHKAVKIIIINISPHTFQLMCHIQGNLNLITIIIIIHLPPYPKSFLHLLHQIPIIMPLIHLISTIIRSHIQFHIHTITARGRQKTLQRMEALRRSSNLRRLIWHF